MHYRAFEAGHTIIILSKPARFQVLEVFFASRSEKFGRALSYVGGEIREGH
jgi:hypothetical protein